MKKIEREHFYNVYRTNFGHLDQPQVDGLELILGMMEIDPAITDLRHAAYMLATIRHETAAKFHPIEEYGKGKGRKYGNPDPRTGRTYYGRGYVQTTWYDNYLRLQDAWNRRHPDQPVDFIHAPEMLLDPVYSYFATSFAMRVGFYTGKKLQDYIHDDACDYLNARRIINGTDCAERIARAAKIFEAALGYEMEAA